MEACSVMHISIIEWFLWLPILIHCIFVYVTKQLICLMSFKIHILLLQVIKTLLFCFYLNVFGSVCGYGPVSALIWGGQRDIRCSWRLEAAWCRSWGSSRGSLWKPNMRLTADLSFQFPKIILYILAFPQFYIKRLLQRA